MVPESAFFQRLCAQLDLDEPARREVLRELEDHVEDAVERLSRDGTPADDARRMVILRFGRPNTFAHLMRQAYAVTPWREAVLGAVPALLLAPIVAARLWQSPVVAATIALLIVTVTLYGLWLGRPPWFYPWAGIALSLPLIAGYIAFAVVGDGIADMRQGAVDASSLLGIVGGGIYFPVGLIIVSGAILVSVRRDWIDASVLLSPLPAAIVWIVAVHRAGGLVDTDASIAGTSNLLGATLICMAVATVALLRAPARSTKVATLIAGALFILLSGSLVAADTSAPAFVARSVMLIAFLLSPMLVARHA